MSDDYKCKGPAHAGARSAAGRTESAACTATLSSGIAANWRQPFVSLTGEFGVGFFVL